MGIRFRVRCPAEAKEFRSEIQPWIGGSMRSRKYLAAFFLSAATASLAGIVDYDGDGEADISELYSDTWYIDKSSNGFGSVDYSPTVYSSQWKGAPADYDGDGLTDIATYGYYGDQWDIDYAADGFDVDIYGWDQNYSHIGHQDLRSIPVPADYDGDGTADLALFHNYSDNVSGYQIDYSGNGFGSVDFDSWYTYLPSTDHPTPADYDGDGYADLSLKNDYGQWGIDYAANGFYGWDVVYSGYGGSNYIAAPADFDGDGSADLVVMHKASSGNGWGIDYSSNGFSGIDSWYNSSITYSYTKPMPSDYDGDGYADIAVKNDDGYWAIDYYTNSFGGWDVVSGSWGDGTAQPFHKKGVKPLASQASRAPYNFAFALPGDSRVTIEAFTLEGKKVAVIFEGNLKQGMNNIGWERGELAGKGMKGGLYVLSLQAKGFQTSKRMMFSE
jgi:hypothetical protein